MELPRLNKTVRKITQLQYDEAGNITPVVIYKNDDNERKVSPMLEPLDKAVRRVAGAHSAFVETYMQRHNRSNTKRRDGWVGDFIPNVAEATRKSGKKLRIKRMIVG
jgi:hypothetical protein